MRTSTGSTRGACLAENSMNAEDAGGVSLLLSFSCSVVSDSFSTHGITLLRVVSAKSHPTLCNPMDLQPTWLLSPWDFLDKNTEVGCHFLLLGIFPTQ